MRVISPATAFRNHRVSRYQRFATHSTCWFLTTCMVVNFPDGKYCCDGWAAVNYTHNFHSFEEFIRAYCDPCFKWHVPLFKQFLYSQLFDEKDHCVADLILKFESLSTALPELGKLGVDLYREHRNKSKRRLFSTTAEYYTPELRALVEAKCARELETFGYDFQGSCKHANFIVPTGLKYNVAGDKLYFA